MKIHIYITTYNRNEYCKQLVEQCLSYNSDLYDINVYVWDDNIKEKFEYNDNKVTVFYNKERRGKKRFWITWNEMFKHCKENKSDFYLFLQDDNCLCDNFFDKMFSIWRTLKEPVTFAPVIDNNSLYGGMSRWGNKKHKKYNSRATLTSWVDCKMLVTDVFFETIKWKIDKINESIWNKNPNLSSGVGEQITLKLQKLGKNMYHATPSLIKICDIKSEMNYNERIHTPLYTDLVEQNKFLNIDKLIVSFTTYKERLPYVHLMVKSLLENTMKPYKIVMTLFKDDVQYISKELQKYIDNGIIELITCDIDIRSHKKYYYVMQKYREYPIITVDDDVYYSKDLIKSLYNTYLKYPDCIIGRRSRVIYYDTNGLAKKYKYWDLNNSIVTPTDNILFTGVGGILYPPNAFNISEKNLEDIYKYITVDDMYLYYLAMLNGYTNVWVKNNETTPKEIKEVQKYGLFNNENKIKETKNPNDVAITELINNRLILNGLKKKEKEQTITQTDSVVTVISEEMSESVERVKPQKVEKPKKSVVTNSLEKSSISVKHRMEQTRLPLNINNCSINKHKIIRKFNTK